MFIFLLTEDNNKVLLNTEFVSEIVFDTKGTYCEVIMNSGLSYVSTATLDDIQKQLKK